MKTITFLIGARPNYMKLAPLLNKMKLINKYKIIVIHSGQHYDINLKDSLLKQLNIDVNINLSCDFSNKISLKEIINIQHRKENIIDSINILLNKNYKELGHIGSILYNLNSINLQTDLFIVFGDVDTSLAGSLFAYINKIKLVHIEAGLRSFDLNMPEEVNRILIDHISDYLFITEWNAINNLNKEGICDNIYYVGNLMYECLFNNISNINKIKYQNKYDFININNKKKYIILTLHRPSNVDDINKLISILIQVNYLGYKVIFPVHPRIKNKINTINYLDNFIFYDPLPYFDFIFLIKNSLCVITDSGGVQEETTFLNIPCYTLRENTERPSTLIKNGGTNQLINDINQIDLTKKYKSSLNIDANVSHKIIYLFDNICLVS